MGIYEYRTTNDLGIYLYIVLLMVGRVDVATKRMLGSLLE